ncbi:MAG TPA: extracellular solute-binding protein [Planctomycetota bacterium]|nr:extracellular solute-binding protein [Planctomycetota bacterium]
MSGSKLKVSVVLVLALTALGWLFVAAVRRGSPDRPIRLEWSVDTWEVYYPGWIAQYEQEHPEVKIDLRVMGSSATQKVYTMLVAGQLSDIVTSSQRNLLVENDAIESVPEARFDFSDVLPVCMAMARRPEGDMIYVPASLNLKPMVYMDKADLDEAGLGVEAFPDDFDGWLKAMKRLEKRDADGNLVRRPFHMKATFFAYGYPWILSRVEPRPGGQNSINDFLGDGRSRPLRFDVPEVMEGLRQWRRVFVGEDQVADGDLERIPGMKKDRYAGAAGGNWMEGELRVNAPQIQWVIIPPPRAADGRRWVHAQGGGWAVARQSRHKEAAWDFVRFLTSPRCQAEAYLAHGYLPARRSAWDLAIDQQRRQGVDATLRYYKVMMDAGVWDETDPTWKRIADEVIIRMLEGVASQTHPVAPAEAATRAQEEAANIVTGKR